MFEYLCEPKTWVVLLTLAGAAFNAVGRWQGFCFWMVTNAYWVWYNYGAGEYEQAIIFVVLELLCVLGLWRWRKKKGPRRA